MPIVNACPIGVKPQFELADGLPAVGNKLFFYVAGSVNTKQDTYTDSTGTVANTNPLVLNSLGMPTTEIWFTATQGYKVVYAPSTDTDPPTSPIWSIDNLYGINDTVNTASQWVDGPAPTFVSATQFTLAGDQTSTFQVGRRVRTINSGGTIYSTITVSAFAALTTITVVNDSGVLDAGLSAVSYGLLTSNNSSVPAVKLSSGAWTFQRTQTLSKGADVASANALALGTDGNYFDITGTTAITSINTIGIGTWAKLHFDGVLTLTHHATDLILPGGANIQTTAGDEAEFVEYASGDWRCTSYVKASGQPVTQTVLQVIEGTPNTTYSSITTAMPYDNSIPQSGEGGEVCTVTITPLSSSNRLVIEAQFFGTSTSSGTVIALYQDSTAGAIAAGVLAHTNDVVTNGGIRYEMAAGTTSATTFKLRAGNNGGATTYVNGTSGGRLLGGVAACRIKVTEISA